MFSREKKEFVKVTQTQFSSYAYVLKKVDNVIFPS